MSRSGSHFLSEFINQGRYAEAASAAHAIMGYLLWVELRISRWRLAQLNAK